MTTATKQHTRGIILHPHELAAPQPFRLRQIWRAIQWPASMAKHHFKPATVCEDGGGNWIAWEHDKPDVAEFTKRAYPNGEGFKCPFGKSGDLLFVKEAWAYAPTGIIFKGDFDTSDGFGSTVVDLQTGETVPLHWFHARYMKAEQSRFRYDTSA